MDLTLKKDELPMQPSLFRHTLSVYVHQRFHVHSDWVHWVDGFFPGRKQKTPVVQFARRVALVLPNEPAV